MAALSARFNALSVSRAPHALCRRPQTFSHTLVQRAAEQRSTVVTAALTRRQRRTQRETIYNRYYITRVKSSCRAALRSYKELLLEPSKLSSEGELKPMDELKGVAFHYIDKAVTNGVMHRNTADRRKRRIDKWRKQVLIQYGFYTPPVEPTTKADPAHPLQ